MKRIILIAFALIILIGAKTLVAQNENQNNQSEEKIKPWTDVVKNTSDPASWTWNKNENTRFAIRGDWDGDGFDEMLYESATKVFSDNDDITPLNLPGDLGVFFLINEEDLDGDGGAIGAASQSNAAFVDRTIGIFIVLHATIDGRTDAVVDVVNGSVQLAFVHRLVCCDRICNIADVGVCCINTRCRGARPTCNH